MKRALLGPASGLLLSALAAAGCSNDPTEGSGPPAHPTFHRDIEPILQDRCQSCHSPGHIAPFDLMTFDDASTVASLMVARTKDRTMPPWGARDTAECKPTHGWLGDQQLTDDQIATFSNWNDDGAPEGDPADAPSPRSFGADELPGVERDVEPKAAFIAAGDKDEFRCFVIDPELTETRYLNGSHFIAGNAKVVHHALVFLDLNDEADALADADGGYDCFGGPGLTSASLIAAWAPGGVPASYPPNAGLPIPAGKKLVMQVHYHPAGTTGAPDSTRFQMRFTDGKPEYTVAVSLIGNFDDAMSGGDGLLPGPNDEGGVEFRIPANVAGHTESMQLTLPAKIGGAPLPELLLYGVATHMHYVGTDMKIDLARKSAKSGEPDSECLVQTPAWDFNWQRSYAYDAAIKDLPKVRAGDVLSFRCTYDNTMQNPFVQRALMEAKQPAPKDVVLGETTLDEMCLGGFSFLYKTPPSAP